MQSCSACALGSRTAASVRMAAVTRVCPIADAQSIFEVKIRMIRSLQCWRCRASRASRVSLCTSCCERVVQYAKLLDEVAVAERAHACKLSFEKRQVHAADATQQRAGAEVN